MNLFLWLVIAVLIIAAVLMLTVYFTARYFLDLLF